MYLKYQILFNKFITITGKKLVKINEKLIHYTRTINNLTLTVVKRWGCNVKKSHEVNSNELWYIWSKNKCNYESITLVIIWLNNEIIVVVYKNVLFYLFLGGFI